MLLLKQGSLYILAGSVTTGVDYGIYSLLLSLDVPVTVSKSLSFIFAIAVSFHLNRTLVFGYRGTDCRFDRFFLLAGVNTGINTLVNALALALLGSTRINLCYVIATSITVICSFLGQKLWVFRSHDYVEIGPNLSDSR